MMSWWLLFWSIRLLIQQFCSLLSNSGQVVRVARYSRTLGSVPWTLRKRNCSSHCRMRERAGNFPRPPSVDRSMSTPRDRWSQFNPSFIVFRRRANFAPYPVSFALKHIYTTTDVLSVIPGWRDLAHGDRGICMRSSLAAGKKTRTATSPCSISALACLIHIRIRVCMHW